ncbi:MAG TPA: hypothetical protein VFB62_12515, partial [Polyangiaceae bacterium]|nr:hypothetical protein [Polyangiaceae bacterium]
MPKTRVVLVAMPWNQLVFPSIQIGTLKAALDRYGIEAETRSYYLRFMEHLAGVDGVPFTPADYAEVVFGYPHGLGDWIFTVPPLRAPSKAEDDDYLALLRRRGVAESVIETATRMREHVPEFLEACKDDLTRIGAEIVGFTTSFNQNIPSLALAKLLKEARPDCCVVFGGANCEGPMGVALHENFPFVDVVVRGEGELVFPELCADWIAGYKMRSRRDVVDAPPVRSMADVPLPDYSEYFACLEQSPVRDDLEPLVEVLFESARGCWWGER